jgi:hypothetical protein
LQKKLGAKRKKKLKFFAECQDSDARQRNSLLSVRFLALGKVIKKTLPSVVPVGVTSRD